MALGTELPALFTNNDNLGEDIINEGIKQIDPMWRLPLFKPYNKQLVLSTEGVRLIGIRLETDIFNETRLHNLYQ